MSKLAKNTLYLTLASIAQKVIAFVYFAIIARYFGVEDTGGYFLALAIVTVVMVLDDLGLTSVIIREVAKKTSDAVLWSRTVIGVKVVTMPVTVVIAFLVPDLLGYDAQVSQLVRIAVVVMLADTLSLSFYGILRGLQNLKYESIGVFVGQLLTASIGFTLMATGEATLPLLIIALATGSTWNVLFSAYFVQKNLGWKAFVPTWQLGWKPLKIAFAFFLAAVFVKVYSYVDSIILSLQMGKEAVGIYAVAYKLTYAFQFLPLAFIGALYPTMSAQSHEPEKLKKTLLNAFWYMALLVGPIVFGIWSLAPEIVTAFYGADFTNAIIPLQILIFVLIPIFLDFPMGSLLNATNNQAIKTAIGGVTMVINVIANLLLIPVLAVSGAAVAAIISFTFMLIADWFFIKRAVKINLIELFGQVGRIFVVSAVMALVVFLVKPFVHFVLAIPLGAVIYVAGLFVTGALNKKHLATARALMKRRDAAYVENPPTND